jgi:hypothetical protein
MKSLFAGFGLLVGALLVSAPVAAQEAAAPVTAAACELHVWPTENYIGIQMGLLSGFGALGAVADMAAHDGRVKTVKDLMRDYLGPEVQMSELEKAGFVKTLGLSGEWRVIVEKPTPWNEEFKEHPELKAEAKAMNAAIKAGKRLTTSTSPCYAELVTTHIFYHKAMMYGSNLFTGWVFREFDGARVKVKGQGQVKNPLEEFPPKAEDKVSAAQAELRDAYTKDFVEYAAKKIVR